jgi:L-ascorbate metabolism protein UlaG (beta-lactamase superfamily)
MSSIQPARKEGKIFQNPIPTGQLHGGFLKLLWQYATSKEERVPIDQLGPFKTDVTVYGQLPLNGLRVTWMGHSSLLIEIDGRRFLTDPVIGRASFVQWSGPKRFFPYPMDLAHLPELDGIILSHDHYDHLDILAMKQLASNKTPFFCSLGVGNHLVRWGITSNRITEMDWGTTVRVADDCSISATPARHFSGRGVINRNQTLWSSFVIKGKKHTIFFGADSGWFPGFKDIGDEYGPFDLTMLEVGAYGEGWPDIHMGPDHATNAHLALNGKIMMPIHWGTFNLALHSWREPVVRTMKYAGEKGIELFLPKPGVPTEVSTGHNSGWWV